MPVNASTGLKEPIDFLNILADNTLLEMIVEKTNYYADQLFLSSTGNENARIAHW